METLKKLNQNKLSDYNAFNLHQKRDKKSVEWL